MKTDQIIRLWFAMQHWTWLGTAAESFSTKNRNVLAFKCQQVKFCHKTLLQCWSSETLT